MNVAALEYKIEQYRQWCGNPLAPLRYRCPLGKLQPEALQDDRLPDMSEAEALEMSRALLALKSCNRKAYEAVYARFWYHWTDTEIGKRLRLGSKAHVHQLRLQAYSALDVYLYRLQTKIHSKE